MGYEGATRDIFKINLRLYKVFPVDNEQKIRLRRKKRESEITETLESLEQYIFVMY